MIAGWTAILVALVYMVALFSIAHFGDTAGKRMISPKAQSAIYALSLAVYCTSWTFFGSVGLASTQGLDFLPIYIGPLLVIGFGAPFLLRVIRLAKSQNITSVADFVAARYGKSEPVAALVAVIAVIGSVPYIALQLKAISASLLTVLGSLAIGRAVGPQGPNAAVAFGIAVILAGFAMAFGTRRLDATEHQDGLMLAIATESVVKLVAFLVVGIYVTWGVFDGIEHLSEIAAMSPRIHAVMSRVPDPGVWITMTLVSASAILLLPRQFHVMVVENRNERDLRTAGWLFPLYLVLINIFVVPIALAGVALFPDGVIDRDMTLLALPLERGAGVVSIIALIGGFSAATAMVIVACVALSIMVSNHLVMPLLLRGRLTNGSAHSGDLGTLVLVIRRVVIVLVLLLAYVYFRFSGEAALASIGLMSFAAVAQIAPAFLGGLFWSRGTARGASWGLVCGTAVWAYTLLLPSLDLWDDLRSILEAGPLGIAALRPTALFGVELPVLTHGVAWSLLVNVVTYVALSLTRPANPIERLQANIFVGVQEAPMGQAFRLWRATTTVGELAAAVARYLGEERTNRSFESFLEARGLTFDRQREADIHLIRFAEHLLSSIIGAASARLVLSLLLRRRNVSNKAALKLLDDASAAIQYNRDLLQHALDHARQGVTVFDRDLRLQCWNREFRDLFDLPPHLLRVGGGLEDIIRFNAERGAYGDGPTDDYVAMRIESLVNDTEPFRLRLYPTGNVIEIRSARMPDGGLVTTYTDVTDAVEAEEALEATNETLERRVRERTEQLTRLNDELARAKAEAEDANLSKTRFLAAASHDILQPLNAARLYSTTLLERAGDGAPAQDTAPLARNVDASLEAVEEILTSLLEISRLDAGAMKPEISTFRVNDILRQLRIEFEPIARGKGLRLAFVGSDLAIRSDRRLLRRLLQNLISNAIKYTLSGRVLVGCRRTKGHLRIEVWDTGLGIPEAKQKIVFQEFERLDEGARTARGLGLGLSIVERIARVLDHRIGLRSTPRKGSVFTVIAPLSAERPAVVATTHSAAPQASHALAGMTVIAIDNEERILEGMRVLLANWGCEVVTGADLESALADLGDRRPDAVVADYHLDNTTGLDVIAALRTHLGFALPAILATADRTPEVRDAATSVDVTVLNKPLKPAALRALLAQWRARKAAE